MAAKPKNTCIFILRRSIMMCRKRWIIMVFFVCVLVVIGFGIWFYSNRKYYIIAKIKSVELTSPVYNKHIVTSNQEAIRVLKKCLREARKNYQNKNLDVETAPISVMIEFHFANGKTVSYEYKIYHVSKYMDPFGDFFDLFPEENVFTMDAYSDYWNDEDIKNNVYSVINEYIQVMSENDSYDVVEENIVLYNQLAEINDAVPYALKYVLEEAETTHKGALALAIANRLLNKDIVVDDSELPRDFWCFFEEGTPKYYAARRVAAENR